MRLPLVVLIGLIVFAFQYESGAYRQDFSADEDEPAHVVSSLLVRDYLAAGLPGNPIRFAESYYVHYPKVAIGHWPPLFHATEGVWMLIFGRNRAAMLALTAALGAALAAAVFAWVRTECGAVMAFVSTLLLIITPMYRAAVYTVEPEILLTALAFWAVVLHGFFLETGSRRFGWLYGVVVVFAMLAHGRGAMLLLVPPVAAVLAGKPGNRKWVGLLLVCAASLTLPPLLGQTDRSSPDSIAQNAGLFLYRLGAAISWPVLGIAMVGAIEVFRARKMRRRPVSMLALVCSGWIFFSLINLRFDEGYLLPLAPAVAALFATGLRKIVDFFRERSVPYCWVGVGCAALAAPIILRGAFIRTVKPDTGCHRLAPELRAWHSPSKIYLVAGDARHEGALVAEIALAEQTPQTIVLRASKMLAESSWAGRGYRLRFTSPEQVETYLDQSRVGLIFLQDSKQPAHMRLLAQDIGRHPEM